MEKNLKKCNQVTFQLMKQYRTIGNIGKRRIHGKPIRFGYKLRSATRHDYLIALESCQGVKSAQLPQHAEHAPEAAVMLHLEPVSPTASKVTNSYSRIRIILRLLLSSTM